MDRSFDVRRSLPLVVVIVGLGRPGIFWTDLNDFEQGTLLRVVSDPKIGSLS